MFEEYKDFPLDKHNHRVIRSHATVNRLNRNLFIKADPLGPRGASVRYKIYTGELDKSNDLQHPDQLKLINTITFQTGDVNNNGVNGISNEALLAILADRLRSFQLGASPSRESGLALEKIEEALHWLYHRGQLRPAQEYMSDNSRDQQEDSPHIYADEYEEPSTKVLVDTGYIEPPQDRDLTDKGACDKQKCDCKASWDMMTNGCAYHKDMTEEQFQVKVQEMLKQMEIDREARLEETRNSGELTDDGRCTFYDESVHAGGDRPCECKAVYGKWSKKCHYYQSDNERTQLENHVQMERHEQARLGLVPPCDGCAYCKPKEFVKADCPCCGYPKICGHNHPVTPPQKTITINAVKISVGVNKLSYGDIVKLAYPNREVRNGLTIVYYKGVNRASGTVWPGKIIEIKNGMIIDVADTNYA